MKAVDRCKVCRRATTHVQRDDPHARPWWRCACGAMKHILSAAAVPS